MDWTEFHGKRGKRDYAIARASGVQFTVDSETQRLHLSLTTPRCASDEQAKRLAEFIRADAVALDVRMRHWLEDDDAQPVKTHGEALAKKLHREADDPIDLASDVGRMLGIHSEADLDLDGHIDA